MLEEVGVLNATFGGILRDLADSVALVLNAIHLTTQSQSVDFFTVLKAGLIL